MGAMQEQLRQPQISNRSPTSSTLKRALKEISLTEAKLKLLKNPLDGIESLEISPQLQ